MHLNKLSIKYLSYQGPAKIDKFEQKYAIVKTLL